MGDRPLAFIQEEFLAYYAVVEIKCHTYASF